MAVTHFQINQYQYSENKCSWIFGGKSFSFYRFSILYWGDKKVDKNSWLCSNIHTAVGQVMALHSTCKST